MTARDIILRELRRIADRVPPWLAAEGASRGRFVARELDAALLSTVSRGVGGDYGAVVAVAIGAVWLVARK